METFIASVWFGTPTAWSIVVILIFAALFYRRALFITVVIAFATLIFLMFPVPILKLALAIATIAATLLVASYVWLLYQTYFSNAKK